MGCEAADIGLTIHPHPTLSESVGMAAEVFEGTITDLYIPKKKCVTRAVKSEAPAWAGASRASGIDEEGVRPAADMDVRPGLPSKVPPRRAMAMSGRGRR